MAMRTGRHLWRVARKDEDEFYQRYLEGRKQDDGYAPIETLHRVRSPKSAMFVMESPGNWPRYHRLVVAMWSIPSWIRNPLVVSMPRRFWNLNGFVKSSCARLARKGSDLCMTFTFHFLLFHTFGRFSMLGRRCILGGWHGFSAFFICVPRVICSSGPPVPW